MPLQNRGNAAAQMGITIATVAVVLIVCTVVLGQLFTTATDMASVTSATGMAVANVSLYTWQGITLVAIGIILMAGMGLIFMLTRGGR